MRFNIRNSILSSCSTYRKQYATCRCTHDHDSIWIASAPCGATLLSWRARCGRIRCSVFCKMLVLYHGAHIKKRLAHRWQLATVIAAFLGSYCLHISRGGGDDQISSIEAVGSMYAQCTAAQPTVQSRYDCRERGFQRSCLFLSAFSHILEHWEKEKRRGQSVELPARDMALWTVWVYLCQDSSLSPRKPASIPSRRYGETIYLGRGSYTGQVCAAFATFPKLGQTQSTKACLLEHLQRKIFVEPHSNLACRHFRMAIGGTAAQQ